MRAGRAFLACGDVGFRQSLVQKPSVVLVAAAPDPISLAGVQGVRQAGPLHRAAGADRLSLLDFPPRGPARSDREEQLGICPAAEIPVPADSPLRREWALICDAPDHPACVTAWEHPGQDQRPDQDRIFEVLWSVDPQVVRDAARIGTSLAAAAFPEMSRRLAARLSEEPAPASADLRRASGILERTLDYLAG